MTRFYSSASINEGLGLDKKKNSMKYVKYRMDGVVRQD